VSLPAHSGLEVLNGSDFTRSSIQVESSFLFTGTIWNNLKLYLHLYPFLTKVFKL
jgi:hypothetical protein